MQRIKAFLTPQALYAAAIGSLYPHEKMQVTKRQTSYDYTKGPMYFLGQQIVKAMQDAGYPAMIFQCYRSPEKQLEFFNKGTSKARAFQSPHQYSEAVDIIHPSLAWDVTDDYWDTLYACAKIVSEKYGIPFTYGYDWGWDKAHIEVKEWKRVRDRYGHMILSESHLWNRFQELLPNIAKDVERRRLNAGKSLYS